MFEFTTILSTMILSVSACGVLALVAPNKFERIARFWGRWVETKPTVPLADRRIDIDDFVLRHARVFGLLLCAGAFLCSVLLMSTTRPSLF